MAIFNYMYLPIFILSGLVALSAIFSGSEIALISLSESKVNELASARVANSKLLKKLKKDPHKLLITILIGNNLVNVGASAYATVIFTELFGSSGIGAATGIMTFLLLIFGEITPKAFAHQHAIGVSLFMARPIYVMQILLFPFVWIFEKIVYVANKILGTGVGQTVTEGEIVAMLNIGAKEGSIEKQEKELIENVLEFNDIEVEEVMTPRVSIEALDSEMTIQEAVDFAIQHSHSRLPVYKKDLDHIVGIITIKELLKHFDEHHPRKKIKSLNLNLPLYVPFSKKINQLFREFQRKHIHIAIVIDEHGGTAGLVTMEDLLEEIVGEIVDEFDIAEKPIEIINARTIMAKGSTLVEDVSDFFRMKIGNEENLRDTVNSLILDHLHRFPREGEVVKAFDMRFTILEIKKNVISKVKIQKSLQRNKSK